MQILLYLCIMQKKHSTYRTHFKNGYFEVSRGLYTNYDWYLSVTLSNGFIDGVPYKRFFCLNKEVFHTKRMAEKYALEVLDFCGYL